MFRRKKSSCCCQPRVHTHCFAGITSMDVDHRHKYNGITDPALDGVPHVHTYRTVTTLDSGHVHEIVGMTGPAIPLPNGNHYHCFEGTTTVSGLILHVHCYRGLTREE